MGGGVERWKGGQARLSQASTGNLEYAMVELSIRKRKERKERTLLVCVKLCVHFFRRGDIYLCGLDSW